MIKCEDGDKTIRAFSISCGVSYSLDIEISVSRPESWSKGISGEAFSGGNERVTGMRDSKVQHTTGSYSHDNDNTAEVLGKFGSGENKRDDSKYNKEKVQVDEAAVFTRECSMVTGILCINGRFRKR